MGKTVTFLALGAAAVWLSDYAASTSVIASQGPTVQKGLKYLGPAGAMLLLGRVLHKHVEKAA